MLRTPSQCSAPPPQSSPVKGEEARKYEWECLSNISGFSVMISREENELLTQTNAGTPCGELLRRYWQPVALSEELKPDGAPVAVTLMGEELTIFRDDKGRIKLEY